MDLHVELGSITFESGVEETGCKLNECYLSRNLFRDEGPLMCTWSTYCDEEEQLEEDDEQVEQTKRAVVFRYDQFRAAYGDMLDPALEEEFKAMQQMGLPTMLVNSYGDMEEEEGNDDQHKPHHNGGRNHHRNRSQPSRRKPVEEEQSLHSREEDMNRSWRREEDKTEQPWRKEEDKIEQPWRREEDKIEQPWRKEEDKIEQPWRKEEDKIEQPWRKEEDKIEQPWRKEEDKIEQPWRREEEDTKEQSWRSDDMEQSWRPTAEDAASGRESDTRVAEEEVDNADTLSDEEGGVVDWDEVGCGQAAGMPGRWVEVVREQQLPSCTEELLTALHLKAQAFADDAWQDYWTSTGPSHLAQCWSQQYPSISLDKVEYVSGIDFLCQTMQTQMSLDTAETTTHHSTAVGNGCPVSEEAEPSNHEILEIWKEFYNNQYWYMYGWYRGQDSSQQQDDHNVDMEQLDQQPNTNQKDNTNSFSDRTVKRCQSMGFSLKEKEEYNPHRRWVRVAAVKLLQSTGGHWPGRHRLLMDEALSAVGQDGRLMAKKRRQKSKETRRKNRKKKKKGKSGSQSAGGPKERNDEEAAEVMSEEEDTKDEKDGMADNTGEEDANKEEDSRVDGIGDSSQEDANKEESIEDSRVGDSSQEDIVKEESMIDDTREDGMADSSQEEDIADISQVKIAPDATQGMVTVGDAAGEPLLLSSLLPPLLSSAPPSLAKYWSQRYRIFSKYDEGVRMDHEGWFSATPEKIAAHIAERCQCDLIVDAFCGVGSNAIQFAFTCERVIAIDIDPVKVACARHNAKIYGVADRIEFIVGDYFSILPQIKCADVVFLSPPWGGPSYSASAVFSLHSMAPLDGLNVFQVARKVTPHIAYYLPRNIDITELVSAVPSREAIEVEQHFLNKKFKTVTAYFGELVEQQEDNNDDDEGD